MTEPRNISPGKSRVPLGEYRTEFGVRNVKFAVFCPIAVMWQSCQEKKFYPINPVSTQNIRCLSQLATFHR